MKTEVTRVETLSSMVSLIEAHRDHREALRDATFEDDEEVGENEVRFAASLDRPVVFADSRRQRVQAELRYFEEDDSGRQQRKVIVWNAADGLPPEVEALRKLSGQWVITSALLDGLRAFMPKDEHGILTDEMRNAEGAAVTSIDRGKARIDWISGPPVLDTIEWTMAHEDGHGEVDIRCTVEVMIQDAAPVVILARLTLDVTASHDDPLQFREYVESFGWKAAGARLVFGEPDDLKGLARFEQSTGGNRPLGYISTPRRIDYEITFGGNKGLLTSLSNVDRVAKSAGPRLAGISGGVWPDD